MQIDEFIQTLKRGENNRIEFTEKPHKEIAEDVCALLNSEGGSILIGISDEGNIKGLEDKTKSEQQVSDFINSIKPLPDKVKFSSIDLEAFEKPNKHILILEIEGDDKLYSYRNRVYLRIGKNNRALTVNEIIEKASESVLILFDEQKTKLPTEIVSKRKVEEYLDQRLKNRGVEKIEDYEECLRRLKITKNGKVTKGGILCFCENPQKHIPYARVRLIKFEDEDSQIYSDNKEFTGNLSKMMDSLEKYFLGNLKIFGGEIEGFKRKEYLEYPIIALREGIANALTHRNYFDVAEIIIFIYPNRIVIRNPGSFPPGVNLSEPSHKPRNPMLSSYLYDLGYIDKWGSGIGKIKKSCEDHPLVNVKFKLQPYQTELIIYKEKDKALNYLDEISKKIIELLEGNKALSSGKICSLLKRSKPTIVSKLNILLSYGLIQKIGSGPKLMYARIKGKGI